MNEKIICAGFGGQGIMLMGKALSCAAMKEGKFVTSRQIRERLFKAGYAEDSIGLGITEVKKSLRERLKFEKKALVQTMKDEDINWSSLVRDPVEQPKAKTVSNFKYWSNQNDARKVFLKALESGEIDDLDSFIALTKKMHEVAVEGADGTNLYYKKPVDPGVYRSGSGWHNNYVDESYEVQNLAKKIGVKIDYDKEWKVRLSGIPENGLPENVGTEHLYPDPRYIDDYFDQMYQSLQRLDEIPLHVNGGQEAAVREIATYYQYGANARPFENINNSIFMNEANVLLRSRGLEEIPHGLLDHAAQRLQPEEFQKLFLKSVAEKNPGL